MRIATCVGDIQLQLLGSSESLSIARGSQVDLDRVIGESDGQPMTVEAALGSHVHHFELQPPPAPTRRGRTEARETAPQE